MGVQEVSWAYDKTAYPAITHPISAKTAWNKKLALDPVYAQVADVYPGPEGARRVFIIQDAHANVSAQRNTAYALDQIFSAAAGIRSVYLEAGFTDESFNELIDRIDPRQRSQIAARLLKKGELQGAQYFHLTSEKESRLIGIEAPAHYASAWEAFRRMNRRRGRLERFGIRLGQAADAAASRIFDREQRALWDEVFGGARDLNTDAKLLARAAAFGATDDRWPQTARWTQEARREPTDPQRLSREFDEAARLLGEETAVELKPDPAAGAFASSAVFEELRHRLVEHKLWKYAASKYPEVARAARSARLALRFDADEWERERRDLERTVFTAEGDGTAGYEVWEARRWAERLLRAARLELTGDEAAEVLSRGAERRLAELSGTVNRILSERSAAPERAVFLDRGAASALAVTGDFYRTAAAREAVMARRILEQMTAGSEAASAVVVGGYHARGLSAALQAAGVEAVVIRPAVWHQTDLEHYRRQILSQFGKNDFRSWAESMVGVSSASAASRPLGRQSATLMALRVGPPRERVLAEFGLSPEYQPAESAARLISVSQDPDAPRAGTGARLGSPPESDDEKEWFAYIEAHFIDLKQPSSWWVTDPNNIEGIEPFSIDERLALAERLRAHPKVIRAMMRGIVHWSESQNSKQSENLLEVMSWLFWLPEPYEFSEEDIRPLLNIELLKRRSEAYQSRLEAEVDKYMDILGSGFMRSFLTSKHVFMEELIAKIWEPLFFKQPWLFDESMIRKFHAAYQSVDASKYVIHYALMSGRIPAASADPLRRELGGVYPPAFKLQGSSVLIKGDLQVDGLGDNLLYTTTLADAVIRGQGHPGLEKESRRWILAPKYQSNHLPTQHGGQVSVFLDFDQFAGGKITVGESVQRPRSFELERYRGTHTHYGRMHRMLAMTGIDFSYGLMNRGLVLLGSDEPQDLDESQRASLWWQQNILPISNGRPVAVLNPFGGESPLKGFIFDRRGHADMLKRQIKSLIQSGFFVVILPNHQRWGAAAIVNEMLQGDTGLVQSRNVGYRVAPDLTQQNRFLYKHIVAKSDIVITVEGGMVHLAYALGKPMLVLPFNTESDRWMPLGASWGQGFIRLDQLWGPMAKRSLKITPGWLSRMNESASMASAARMSLDDDSTSFSGVRETVGGSRTALKSEEIPPGSPPESDELDKWFAYINDFFDAPSSESSWWLTGPESVAIEPSKIDRQLALAQRLNEHPKVIRAIILRIVEQNQFEDSRRSEELLDVLSWIFLLSDPYEFSPADLRPLLNKVSMKKCSKNYISQKASEARQYDGEFGKQFVKSLIPPADEYIKKIIEKFWEPLHFKQPWLFDDTLIARFDDAYQMSAASIFVMRYARMNNHMPSSATDNVSTPREFIPPCEVEALGKRVKIESDLGTGGIGDGILGTATLADAVIGAGGTPDIRLNNSLYPTSRQFDNEDGPTSVFMNFNGADRNGRIEVKNNDLPPTAFQLDPYGGVSVHYGRMFRMLAATGLNFVYGLLNRGVALLGTGEERGSADEAAADKWWDKNVEFSRQGLPVAILNPFGGEVIGKGFAHSDEAHVEMLNRQINSLIEAGFFIVILPNHKIWGGEAVIRKILKSNPNVSNLKKSTYCVAPPITYENWFLHKYIVAKSDIVITVEGGTMHLAYALGKPMLVLPFNRDSDKWFPLGASWGQGLMRLDQLAGPMAVRCLELAKKWLARYQSNSVSGTRMSREDAARVSGWVREAVRSGPLRSGAEGARIAFYSPDAGLEVLGVDPANQPESVLRRVMPEGSRMAAAPETAGRIVDMVKNHPNDFEEALDQARRVMEEAGYADHAVWQVWRYLWNFRDSAGFEVSVGQGGWLDNLQFEILWMLREEIFWTAVLSMGVDDGKGVLIRRKDLLSKLHEIGGFEDHFRLKDLLNRLADKKLIVLTNSDQDVVVNYGAFAEMIRGDIGFDGRPDIQIKEAGAERPNDQKIVESAFRDGGVFATGMVTWFGRFNLRRKTQSHLVERFRNDPVTPIAIMVAASSHGIQGYDIAMAAAAAKDQLKKEGIQVTAPVTVVNTDAQWASVFYAKRGPDAAMQVDKYRAKPVEESILNKFFKRTSRGRVPPRVLPRHDFMANWGIRMIHEKFDVTSVSDAERMKRYGPFDLVFAVNLHLFGGSLADANPALESESNRLSYEQSLAFVTSIRGMLKAGGQMIAEPDENQDGLRQDVLDDTDLSNINYFMTHYLEPERYKIKSDIIELGEDLRWIRQMNERADVSALSSIPPNDEREFLKPELHLRRLMALAIYPGLDDRGRAAILQRVVRYHPIDLLLALSEWERLQKSSSDSPPDPVRMLQSGPGGIFCLNDKGATQFANILTRCQNEVGAAVRGAAGKRLDWQDWDGMAETGLVEVHLEGLINTDGLQAAQLGLLAAGLSRLQPGTSVLLVGDDERIKANLKSAVHRFAIYHPDAIYFSESELPAGLVGVNRSRLMSRSAYLKQPLARSIILENSQPATSDEVSVNFFGPSLSEAEGLSRLPGKLDGKLDPNSSAFEKIAAFHAGLIGNGAEAFEVNAYGGFLNLERLDLENIEKAVKRFVVPPAFRAPLKEAMRLYHLAARLAGQST